MAVALSAQTVLAQAWTTVLQYAPSKSGALGYAIAADPSGDAFSCGLAGGGYVLGTTVANETQWSVRLALTDTSATAPSLYHLGFDDQGNLYAVGETLETTYISKRDRSTQDYWSVTKSSNGGASWNPVDYYQYVPGLTTTQGGLGVNAATGFTADNQGNIYVVGWVQDAAGTYHGLVRKSSDGGGSWTLALDLPGYEFGHAAFSPATGAIFVVGNLGPAGGELAPWLVERSLDYGATWQAVDTPTPAPFSSAASDTVACDSAGNVYVVGRAVKETATSTNVVWLTRQSADGGDTWQTMDAVSAALARGVAVTPSGTVVVVGQAEDAQGTIHWITRTNSGSGWQPSDDFQLAPGAQAVAEGVTTDAAGNILVTGFALSSSRAASKYWVVRKLAP